MHPSEQIFSGIAFIWRRLGKVSRWGLLGATAAIAVAAWLNSLIPVILGNLASDTGNALRLAEGISFAAAKAALLALLGCFAGREMANLVRKYILHRITTKAERDGATRLVGHLLRLDLGKLREFHSGALQGRIRRCVDGHVRLLKLTFMDMVPAILTAGFAVVMALTRNVWIGGLILLSLPFLFFAVWWQARSQQGIRVSLLRSKEQMEGMIAEQLAGIETIRCADTHAQEEQAIASKAEALRRVEMKHHTAMGWFDFLKVMIESVFFVAVTGLSIWLVARGKIAVGEIVTSSMLFASVLGPVREIHRIIDEASESAIAVSDFRQLLDLPVDVSFNAATSAEEFALAATLPAIAAKNLRVGYGGANGASVILDSLNLVIPHGQVVGIVGKTGCGKSTLLRVLLRLIHPIGGELLLYGHPVDTLDRAQLSRMIGVVGQHPFIRSGTIQENVTYGSTNGSLPDIQAALEKAALASDLETFEAGLTHRISEGGSNLAGGQRQRLAVARLLYSPKPLMIFDEATSALDNTSEATVLRSIMALRVTSTVLMVAHRLSTLRDVDRILCFEDGKVVEDGTFRELIARNGAFAKLVRAAESAENPDGLR
jgi:ATP-binding cassette subfamily B protein